MPLDVHAVFGLNVSGFELFVRTTLIYLGLMAAMRYIAQREAGSLELPDLLMIVLIADGVQNGMSGKYSTVTGAAIVGGTIIGWNYVLTMLAYRFESVRALVRPKPLLLIRNGVMVRENMRKEFVTPDELMSLLRTHDVYDLRKVAVAYLEANGELSVRKRGGEPPSGHRRVTVH